jgi:hypothetical protein
VIPHPPKPPPTPKQLGPPLGLTDAELDAAAAISPADAKAAAARWRRDSPPWSQGLIDAAVAEPDG